LQVPEDVDEQRSLADAFDSALELVNAARERTDALTRLRGSVISALLSGSHLIPASYDRFVGGSGSGTAADAATV
jgi:hypothetical protein